MAGIEGLTEEQYRKLLIQAALEQGNLTGMSQQAQVAAQQGRDIGAMDIPQTRHWSGQLAQGLRGALQGRQMGKQNALNQKVSEGQLAYLKRMNEAVNPVQAGMTPGISAPSAPITPGMGMPTPQVAPVQQQPGMGADVMSLLTAAMREKKKRGAPYGAPDQSEEWMP